MTAGAGVGGGVGSEPGQGSQGSCARPGPRPFLCREARRALGPQTHLGNANRLWEGVGQHRRETCGRHVALLVARTGSGQRAESGRARRRLSWCWGADAEEGGGPGGAGQHWAQEPGEQVWLLLLPASYFKRKQDGVLCLEGCLLLSVPKGLHLIPGCILFTLPRMYPKSLQVTPSRSPAIQLIIVGTGCEE